MKKRLKSSKPAWLPDLPDPRDEEILSAAFAIFCEKGFHGATMLEVARRSRASKATLYSRFKDKERLFQALLKWGMRQYSSALEAIQRDPSVAPIEGLIQVASMILGTMMKDESLALFRIAVSESTRSPQIGRIYSDLVRQQGEPIVSLFSRRLGEMGAIRAQDAPFLGDALLGLLRGEVFYRALLGVDPPLTEKEIHARARRVVELLIRSFSQSPRSRMN